MGAQANGEENNHLGLSETAMEQTPALKKLEEALAEHYGWSGHPLLREKVNAAVANKAARLGIEPHEYCQIASASQSELLALVEEAAASESYFFREPEQFDFLRAKILPELMESHQSDDKLRLWSAACSTGEEAYSLAIAFNQVNLARPEESHRQVEVFATDVRNRALLGASQARYNFSALAEIDPLIRERFFEDSDSLNQTCTPIPDVRRVVAFRRINLLDRLFWKGVVGKFDLIVCANQLLYLHGSAVRQMIVNLANSLRDGGYLMVASAEVNLITSAELIQSVESPSFYKKC